MYLNTTTDKVYQLPAGKDWVYVFEDLELAFEKQQLKEITKQWNEGADLKQIGKLHLRKPLEILLALMHQARRGVIIREFY